MMELEPPKDDGLVLPEVSPWSCDKHHFLARYIDAFTTAMKGKRWAGLHYIDMFAGAGIERIESTRRLEWGSPLIAAQAPFPFKRLHLCEQDDEKIAALSKRVSRLRPDADDQLLHGDANRCIHDVVSAVPPKSLCLAFLDPYGLHLDFGTLRAMADIRADLIIFFPDRLDILRNWKTYYWGNPDSNLDAVLGPNSNWRKKILHAPAEKRVEAFLRLYEAQIRTLGYAHFEREPIPSEGNRLYWLIFCSKAAVAARIWGRVSLMKRSGQRTMEFPSTE